jgi:DNA-binding response OmpR family regulator
MSSHPTAAVKRVLVVDDHGQCRDMSARLLGFLGYEVVTARDEAQADELLVRHQGEIVAVVLDLCLSPAGDVTFARRLAAERPQLPVLFVSGHCKEVCVALDLLGPHRQFLEKPFSISQLEGALEGLLSTTPLEGAPPRKRILLIEDDPDSRAELRLLLEEEGYSVIHASDGRSGLRLAKDHPPDMIIQDLLLPDTHGFDLVTELRRLPGVSTMPIVALSAFPDRLTEARANALGFTGFFRKPPAVSELCATVRRLLAPPDDPTL